MRKLAVLALAVVFAAAPAGLAVAQTGAAPAAADKKADGAMHGSKKAPTKTARGTVKSASAESLVVAGRDKGKETEWTFAVDNTTSVRKGTKSITPGDLKPGDPVQVRYMEHDGKPMAQSIIVRGGTKAADATKREPKAATK